jgi:hypothetical protein
MCRSMENKALGFQSCKGSSKQRFVISKAIVKAEYSQVYMRMTARRVRKMYGWLDCNIKRSLDYITADR